MCLPGCLFVCHLILLLMCGFFFNYFKIIIRITSVKKTGNGLNQVITNVLWSRSKYNFYIFLC